MFDLKTFKIEILKGD